MKASTLNSAHTDSPYLRGDAAGGYYLGMADKQGRSFRTWAEENRLPFTPVAGVRTYRKIDVDRAWKRGAVNQANLAEVLPVAGPDTAKVA